LADHWALFYKEKNADLNNRRRQDPEYNDDDDDADTLSDYKHFFGRDEDKYPSYFCDSDGEYRPELEAAHDRKEQIRTQFEAERLENLKGNNGTVLTRSPCSLGPDWVRHKNRDDHTEGRGTTQNQKAEATSPHERAKKRHERAEATRVEKTRTATKAEATGDEKKTRIDDGTTTTKKKKKNKKKAAASTSRPAAATDPTSITDLPLGSRVPCLGCGEVLTTLPSRQAPEHCDLCVDWHGRICDTFQRLENDKDDRLKASDEKELEKLWAERGGDPQALQETREKWNTAGSSLSTAGTSAPILGASSSATTASTTSTATNTSSSTDTTSKKKKKKRKQRAKQVVITIQENDDDDYDDEIDPMQLGWEEHARRGRLDATTTNSGVRGRPYTRKQL
jgi:hypothetical protein